MNDIQKLREQAAQDGAIFSAPYIIKLIDEIEALRKEVNSARCIAELAKAERNRIGVEMRREMRSESIMGECLLRAKISNLGAEIEALRKQIAEPVRKVQVSHKMVDQFMRIFCGHRGRTQLYAHEMSKAVHAGLVAALKAAGIEVENE